jgi:outer membrane cobalamin receptor
LLSILGGSSLLLSQQPPPPDNADKTADLEPVRTSITVSGHIATEAPAFISTMDQRDLDQTPGTNLDDQLRQVPGYTLFRRTSSVAANPTTQGVSLRGIGSSGASRTLVLWDGVPMNDPFGSWVYWTRFAPDQIQDVEISRGASTSLFGDRAMSGAIAIFSRAPEAGRLQAAYEAGNENTQDLSVGGSDLWRHFAVSGEVRALSTDGYFIVPASIRGTADTRAGVDFVAGNIRFDLLGFEHRLFLKLDILAEDRANGTVLTHNSTGLGTMSANYSWQHASNGISVIAYHTQEDFHASFSSVTNNRDTEKLTYTQRVPADATGSAAYWSHSATMYNLLAGADFERVEGWDTDHLVPTGIRVGGGERLEHGTFAQFNGGNSWVRFFAGARYTFTGGDERFFSPSAGFATGRGRLRFRGSGYRSFRAPTLNELYRDFRAGNTDTLPNAALRSESLTGGETGVDFSTGSTRFSATLFYNAMDRLITNVTLSTTPTAITRQRQNAGAAVAKGLEANVRRSWRAFRGEASYLYVDSRYDTGPRIPEVARHQGTAQLSWARGGTLAAAGVRSFSNQFDDDLNQYLLPGYTTVQLMARQKLKYGLAAQIAFENLLNRQYYVAFTPTPNIGAPRLWRASLRWEGRLW